MSQTDYLSMMEELRMSYAYLLHCPGSFFERTIVLNLYWSLNAEYAGMLDNGLFDL